MDELGGFGGGVVSLDQQVLVEVSDPAAGLQLDEGRRFGTLTLSSSVDVEVHQVLQRAAVCPVRDR